MGNGNSISPKARQGGKYTAYLIGASGVLYALADLLGVISGVAAPNDDKKVEHVKKAAVIESEVKENTEFRKKQQEVNTGIKVRLGNIETVQKATNAQIEKVDGKLDKVLEAL